VVGLVDSHCHINFPDLAADLPGVMARMQAADVTHALCVSVSLETFPEVLRIAQRFPNIYASVGVHPNERGGVEPTVDELAQLAADPKVLAIGETGLDYYRQTGDLDWQRQRFRTHIQAARACRKPLIIHCRQAAPSKSCRQKKLGRWAGSCTVLPRASQLPSTR
jgi:TatD DNase family protein